MWGEIRKIMRKLMNNLKQIEALGALGGAWAVLVDFGLFWDNFWGAFGGTFWGK